jgi:hypothetical protein
VLMAGLVICGLLCAYSVNAEVSHPELDNKYMNLRDVEMHKAKLPRYESGMSRLSKRESRYSEKLQLNGAIEKISAKQYKRTRL